MFVAASTRCFADLSFAEACAQILDLEFDKLEIWVDADSQHLTPTELADDPEGFVTRYREATRITPVAISFAQDIDPGLFQAVSRAAKLLRITQVTIPASPLGTPFNSEIDRLREVVRIASQDAVRLSLKTEAGRLTEDPHTAMELCQAVPGLGITLDPSFYLTPSTGEKALDLLTPNTFHVQLRDSTAARLQVQVGLGEVDYSRLVQQLRRIRYNRALSIEFFPESLDKEQRPLEMRKMRMLLDSLL